MGSARGWFEFFTFKVRYSLSLAFGLLPTMVRQGIHLFFETASCGVVPYITVQQTIERAAATVAIIPIHPNVGCITVKQKRLLLTLRSAATSNLW